MHRWYNFYDKWSTTRFMLRWGVFTCVGWKVIPYGSLQVTSRTSQMEFH